MALIASRGLNIVLQGMITRISELIPDEKRKLIEQMVGIAQFDEKKQLALTQLREADVKLEVAMAKIGEIRDRVQSLEQQRNDQLRLKQLEDQIRCLRAASASTKLNTVRRMIQLKKDTANEHTTKLSQFQSHLTEIRKTAMDSGTAKIEAELGSITNELNTLKKERREATEYLDKMRQVSPYLSKMLEDQKQRIAHAGSQIVLLQDKLREAETRKQDMLNAQGQLN